MKKAGLLLIQVLLFSNILLGQQSPKMSKFYAGLEINVGSSFPNFDRPQTRWKGGFYGAGGMNVSITTRLNQRWMADLGVGLTMYALANKGPIDTYVLDFASPHLQTGIEYCFLKQRYFIKLSYGFQLGYQGEFFDQFETYQIIIQGKNKLYHFVRPEIGIRREFNKKMKDSKFNIAYELGVFFRYNFNSLGTARIQESNFEVTLEPKGNVIGVFCRFLFPTGRKSLQVKEKTLDLPPIIYHPRQMSD